MDDVTILALLKSDPHVGYVNLLEKYQGLVGAIIWRILPKCQEDAEECIADTFIQIWKGAVKELIDGAQLKGLLIWTARNIAINRYRKIKKSPTVPFIEELEPAASDNVLNELIVNEDASWLMSIINQLAEPNREIVTRRYFLYESVKEISETMKLPAKQIENRLYQSKLYLRKALDEGRTPNG
jgi:RNA polymerase sigma-70 factor, ECF subfamily